MIGVAFTPHQCEHIAFNFRMVIGVSTLDPATELRRLVNGYQISQAIHVAASLGIADLLAGGPRSASELAEQTGTHAGSLHRLLRALAAIGIFHEEESRRFSLAPIGECLRADAPHSIAPWAIFVGQKYIWEAWGNLAHSITNGRECSPAGEGETFPRRYTHDDRNGRTLARSG